MAFEVETKDCTAVADAELGELEAVVADSPFAFSMGLLSKQTEEWVLLTTARENEKLSGFVFYTLERIGGTPAVIMGLAAIERNNRRNATLRSLMSEVYHRALMAFPDEDVVFGTQLNNSGGFEVFKDLEQELPRPNHKISGEERAWGRRFAKRMSIPTLAYDDRTFTALGGGSMPCIFDHESLKPEKINSDVQGLFKQLEIKDGDTLIAFAWAMSESLEKLGN